MSSFLYFLFIDSVHSPISFVAGLLIVNRLYLIKQNRMAMKGLTEKGLEIVIKNNSNNKNREVTSISKKVECRSQNNL